MLINGVGDVLSTVLESQARGDTSQPFTTRNISRLRGYFSDILKH
jgi:hypothetical protein